MWLKEEFYELKQGNMTVHEYLTKFNQLSRYAPIDIEDDEEKQERFRDGLREGVSLQLSSNDFTDFQHLVDKALVVEHKCKVFQTNHKRHILQQVFHQSISQRSRGDILSLEDSSLLHRTEHLP